MPPGAFRTSGFPSGRLIRLLGDGGHYRYGISGVLWNSKLANPGFVGTVMSLGKWKVESIAQDNITDEKGRLSAEDATTCSVQCRHSLSDQLDGSTGPTR